MWIIWTLGIGGDTNIKNPITAEKIISYAKNHIFLRGLIKPVPDCHNHEAYNGVYAANAFTIELRLYSIADQPRMLDRYEYELRAYEFGDAIPPIIVPQLELPSLGLSENRICSYHGNSTKQGTITKFHKNKMIDEVNRLMQAWPDNKECFSPHWFLPRPIGVARSV